MTLFNLLSIIKMLDKLPETSFQTNATEASKNATKTAANAEAYETSVNDLIEEQTKRDKMQQDDQDKADRELTEKFQEKWRVATELPDPSLEKSPQEQFLDKIGEATKRVKVQLESSKRINKDAREDRGDIWFADNAIISYKAKTDIQIEGNQLTFLWAEGHDLSIIITDLNSPKEAERVVRIANIINLLKSKSNVKLLTEYFVSSKFFNDTNIISRKAIQDLGINPSHLNKYLAEFNFQREQNRESKRQRKSRERKEAQTNISKNYNSSYK